MKNAPGEPDHDEMARPRRLVLALAVGAPLALAAER